MRSFAGCLTGRSTASRSAPTSTGRGPARDIDEAQIRDRLAIIQPHVRWVRSFSCTDGNEATPRIAHESGLKTMVGVWLQSDHEKNEIGT